MPVARACASVSNGAAGSVTDRLHYCRLHYSPFDLETAASRLERYLKWFENYVVAKGITHDARKKCLLLYVAGKYVLGVADVLAEVELTYAALKDKLNEHIALKQNVEYEIFTFR